MNQNGGTSPSTLVQLAVSSLPPVDPGFFNLVDSVVDTSVPVPANDVPNMMGGNNYYTKYLKYKAKYTNLVGGRKYASVEKKQKGGFLNKEARARISARFASKDASMRTHIQHCISQLKRFSVCIETKPIRAYQFFFNLGRLKELLDELTFPQIWWTPFEELVKDGRYGEIPRHIDILKEAIGVLYDDDLIAKGC
jgi:hypothetical protein